MSFSFHFIQNRCDKIFCEQEKEKNCVVDVTGAAILSFVRAVKAKKFMIFLHQI